MSRRTSIRIPDDIYQQLVERARAERRTVSNLVIALLAQAVGSSVGSEPTIESAEGQNVRDTAL